VVSNLVSVDLDRASTLHLLRTYLSGKRMLPTCNIKPYISGRGVGYHFKIFKPGLVMPHLRDLLYKPETRERFLENLENLMIRALLWDDPVRIAFALKKWALNPAERYVDLVFDEKLGRKEVSLDLDGILSKYVREVAEIMNKIRIGESDKAEELAKGLADRIDPEIKAQKKPTWVGCIAYNGDDKREYLEEVCRKIMERDLDFKWRMYPCFFPEFDWMLCVFADDKDAAWKKIVWIKNNAYVVDRGEEIGEKKYILRDLPREEIRLWVKERRAT